MLDARLVRLILKACSHLLSPRHYDKFLKQADMERFKEPSPDPCNEIGVPIENMTTFIQAVVDKIGLEASRLFFANVAEEVSWGIIKSSYAAEFKKELAKLNPDERYVKAVQKFTEWSNTRGSEFDLHRTNSPEVWQLVSLNCFYCGDVHYDAPFCDVVTVNLRNVISFLAGMPVRAVELECRAKGDQHCVFEVGEAWN